MTTTFILRKLIILFSFAVFYSCSGQKNKPASTPSLTLIALKDSFIAFKGILNAETPVQYIKADTFALKEWLTVNKKQSGDSIPVFIKLTDHEIFMPRNFDCILFLQRNANVILPQLLTADEKKRFSVNDIDFTPPDPGEIKMPEPVHSKSEPGDSWPALYFHITDKGTVYYLFIDSTNHTEGKKEIKEPLSENTYGIIKTIKETYLPEFTKNIMIIGGQNQNYTTFKTLMNALQRHEINSFKLVTGPSNGEDRLNEIIRKTNH